MLVFPTSMGRFYQNEDFQMIDTLRWRLEAGEIQMLCVDGSITKAGTTAASPSRPGHAPQRL